MNNLKVGKRDISARITYTTTESIKRSFEPICDSDASILILGTLPGDKSFKIGEYYGHPRNRFWQIIASITENSIPKTYTEKKNLLHRTNIGIWDIAHSAARIGSLDTSIENEEPNDLLSFFKKYKNIRTVAFNGVKSEKLYNKYFLKKAEINYVLLPSSSPANAGISMDEICKQWAKRLALLR